ncbi:hypothetical protein LzC2_30610 [Planctomycetes bacterium LzC2]|uniref:YopA central domain-containing protein n=1 Tax=Alienimonas chondri TaxID=2681879 RepID=A0ABX1VFR6_9PLAN|nr:hypothetical protein [Alienimonas chondri]
MHGEIGPAARWIAALEGRPGGKFKAESISSGNIYTGFITNSPVHWSEDSGTRESATGVVTGSSCNRHPVDRLQLHFINICDYSGDPVRNAVDRVWWGGSEFAHGNWRLLIDTVSHLEELQSELARSRGFAFTHAGLLQRQDGRAFRFHEAKPFLEAIELSFAFSYGALVGPLLCRGVSEGVPVFIDVSQPHLKDYRKTRTWRPPSSTGVGHILPLMVDATADPVVRRELRHIILWYVETARYSTYVEGGIILLHSCLEALAWLHLVHREKYLTEQAWGDLKASDKISLLLRVCSIPAETPPHFRSLHSAARGMTGKGNHTKSTVELLTEARNKLVHTSTETKRIRDQFSSDLLRELSELSLWLVEAAVLHAIGFKGDCRCRIRESLADQLMRVPWSAA